MDSSLVALGREALVLVLLLSAPPLVAALALGVVTGILQVATQVQDASLPVVPRLAAVLVALAVAGPWMGARLVRFAAACFELSSRLAP